MCMYVLVILVFVNVLYQSSLESLVHSFIQAICLRLLGGRYPMVCSRQLKQLLVHFIYKFSTLVRHHYFCNPVSRGHIVKELVSYN